MMSSDLFFRDKIPVAILGATGKFGERLIHKLAQHPWFQIVALCDDLENSWRRTYGEVVSESFRLPESIKNLLLHSSEVPLSLPLVFSALQNREGSLWKEKLWAQSGAYVISSASDREVESIPLIIPEVNSNYLSLLFLKSKQEKIIGTPHPLVYGLVLALKPLMDRYGIEAVQIDACQLDDHNSAQGKDEEIELEQQILYLLGSLEGGGVKKASFAMSFPGDFFSRRESSILVGIKLKKKAEFEEIIQSWLRFRSESDRLTLPSAFYHPLFYRTEFLPVPDPHQIAVYLNDIQPSLSMDFSFKLSFSDHFEQGVSSLILNAELLLASGHIYW